MLALLRAHGLLDGRSRLQGTMSAPLKVMLLLEDLHFGGTQRQAVELARRFAPERVQVCLRMLLRGDDFAPVVREYGLDAQWLTRSTRLGPRGVRALWRCLKQERPDVLVLLTALPNIWGRVVARLQQLSEPVFPGKKRCAPLVIGNIRQSGAPRRYHERFLKGLADHHICNAASLKAQLVEEYGLPPERVSVILNGVDVMRFRPAEESTQSPPQGPPQYPPVLLHAARLVADKDQDTLIRAFVRVASEHETAELHIYGDGPLRGALQQQIDSLPQQTARRIRLQPGQAGLEALYRQASLFALSSLREGLPNVVLEAMASGLPVVATAVDGVPELVDHGVNGLLAPPGDDQVLAAAMLELLGDSERRAIMGQASRQRAEREFSYENAARAHEALFEQLVGREKEEGGC